MADKRDPKRFRVGQVVLCDVADMVDSGRFGRVAKIGRKFVHVRFEKGRNSQRPAPKWPSNLCSVMECRRCDGCGDYEGGPKYLLTTCEVCKGAGVVAESQRNGEDDQR